VVFAQVSDRFGGRGAEWSEATPAAAGALGVAADDMRVARWSTHDMATVDDVRHLGSELERSYEVFVRGRLKFRVGQIVYVAFDLDETVMELAFPKEEREALVGGEPAKFEMPATSDLRFNWVRARLVALDPAEARELVVDAWRMVVPQKVWRAYDLTHPDGPG
jgi:hypothetical protein